MEHQLRFDFSLNESPLPAHPLVVMRWCEHHRHGKVEVNWVDFKLTSWFINWQVALDHVLHPLNDHVRLKVRV